MRNTAFFFCLLLLPGFGQACEAPRALRQTTPAEKAAGPSPVTVSFTQDHGELTAHFTVQSRAINGKPTFGPRDYPFQYDVVELFLSAEGGLPYYEVEITPYDQTFEVKIQDPHRPFENGVDLGLVHHASRTATGWEADLTLPLERLGWKGDEAAIVGNAFAILGKGPGRKYYSLSLPLQAKARFHLPEFFRPLPACLAGVAANAENPATAR